MTKIVPHNQKPFQLWKGFHLDKSAPPTSINEQTVQLKKESKR